MTEYALPEQRPIPDDVAMALWTIYERPTDYPSGYVLRANFAMKNGHSQPDIYAWYATSADALREILPPGKICIGRNDRDDPVILEVWV
jgi:hypothetical protein